MDVQELRKEFTQLDEKVYGKPLVYLDNAATSLRPRSVVRKWVEDNVRTEEWEAAGEVPKDVYLKCAKDGLLMPIAAGRKIPKEWYGYPIIGGIKPEEWDGFHDLVLWDELYRGGAISSIFVGLVCQCLQTDLY